jgi:hypothetical protein
MTPQETILYEELKKVGSQVEGLESINKLESPFIDSIVATLDYFNVGNTHLKLTNQVLSQERMKIVDYLGMSFSGRYDLKENEAENFNFHQIITKMVKLYILQKDVGGFAWWLRGHDLDIEKPSYCKDCITSYEEWHAEQVGIKN